MFDLNLRSYRFKFSIFKMEKQLARAIFQQGKCLPLMSMLCSPVVHLGMLCEHARLLQA